MKHWRTFEHTSDIGLAGRGETLGELFETMAEGLAEQIVPRRQVAARQKRKITVVAEDVEALLVDFLAEVMNAIQTDRFIVAAVDVGRISQTSVAAELSGQAYDPARHQFAREIKAVTYHQLEIAQDDDGWTGRVILDI